MGEEKRIQEEMKRQKEIDLMYELMNTKADQILKGKNEITFDFEGKIIQVKKPADNTLPNTVELPKVKFKQAIVRSNYLKEILDQARARIMKEKPPEPKYVKEEKEKEKKEPQKISFRTNQKPKQEMLLD